MSVEVKWENYMIAHKNRDFQKTVSERLSTVWMEIEMYILNRFFLGEQSSYRSQHSKEVMASQKKQICNNMGDQKEFSERTR